MSKVHLSKETIQQRISDLTQKLQTLKNDPQNKKFRLRIYKQLSKFNKALKDPSLIVDPLETQERISKHRLKKIAKIKKLDKKHRIQAKLEAKLAKVKCINCQENGHKMKDCPLLDAREVYCYSCGSRSHTYKDCQSGGFQYAVCFHCEGIGHLARDCTEKKRIK